MKMTFEKALIVLQDVKENRPVSTKEFDEAVEVMFEQFRKVEHLEKQMDQMKRNIKNKNRYIRKLEHHNDQLRNDVQAK